MKRFNNTITTKKSMIDLNLGSRKVQLIRGTLFISLPRIWARNFNIKRGSEVMISLKDDGSLEISHDKRTEEGESSDIL